MRNGSVCHRALSLNMRLLTLLFQVEPPAFEVLPEFGIARQALRD